MPGLSQANQDEARNNILKAAFLEFRMVHPDSDQLLKDGMIPPGYEKLFIKYKEDDGTSALEPLLVQKKLANGLTGKYIKRAAPNRDPISNQPVIDFQFDSVGAEKFANLTENHMGERLAIVLDGQLYSAPVHPGAHFGQRPDFRRQHGHQRGDHHGQRPGKSRWKLR